MVHLVPGLIDLEYAMGPCRKLRLRSAFALSLPPASEQIPVVFYFPLKLRPVCGPMISTRKEMPSATGHRLVVQISAGEGNIWWWQTTRRTRLEGKLRAHAAGGGRNEPWLLAVIQTLLGLNMGRHNLPIFKGGDCGRNWLRSGHGLAGITRLLGKNHGLQSLLSFQEARVDGDNGKVPVQAIVEEALVVLAPMSAHRGQRADETAAVADGAYPGGSGGVSWCKV